MQRITLTSPVMAPLYRPTQARSDCSDSRSACVMASAVADGVCIAGGRIGAVWTGFGLAPEIGGVVIWAFAPVAAANIKVAASIDLMTNPAGPLNAMPLKHISLVANNDAVVQMVSLILRSREAASRRMQAELPQRGLHGSRRRFAAPHHEG